MEVTIVIITQRAPSPINNCHTPAIIDTADTHIFLPRRPEEIALLLFLIVCLLYCFFEIFFRVGWRDFMGHGDFTLYSNTEKNFEVTNIKCLQFSHLKYIIYLTIFMKKNFWEASFQWFSSIKSVMDWLREVWKGQKVRVDDTSNPKTSWVASKPL